MPQLPAYLLACLPDLLTDLVSNQVCLQLASRGTPFLFSPLWTCSRTIENNQIGQEGAAALSETLKINATLTELN